MFDGDLILEKCDHIFNSHSVIFINSFMFYTLPHDIRQVKRYLSFISTRSQDKSNYVEKHHIFPECLGGSSDESNLVFLTYREHYIAHIMLAKCFTGIARSKMIFALNNMSRTSPKMIREVSQFKSKYYSKIKQWRKDFCSGENHPNFGRKFSEESRKKMSVSSLGKLHSNETKKKISDFASQQVHSNERRQTSSNRMKESNPMKGLFGEKNPNFGSKRSEETKQKMREAKARARFNRETSIRS